MKSNRICRICLKSTPRVNVVAKLYCSTACRLKKVPRCKPVCKDGDMVMSFVTFRDETEHIRKYCNICRMNYGFVNRYTI